MRWHRKFNRAQPFSEAAENALDLLSDFGALRFPYADNEPATVVKRMNFPDSMYSNPNWKKEANLILPDAVRDELILSGILVPLTCHQHFNRIGWREAGLDGTQAEFWCLIQ